MDQAHLPADAGPVNWAGPDTEAYAASGLIHCVRLPAGTGAGPRPLVPAVVMLHGWGGEESSMWVFERVLPPGAAVITPRAPIDLHNGGYVWFRYTNYPGSPEPDAVRRGVDRLVHFLQALPRLYPIDPARLVLVSFSQGAMVSSALVMTRPDLVIGLASLAGAVLELPEFANRPNLLAGLPVFIAHGSDDPYVPVQAARHARERYAALGANVTYGEYPIGHKVSPQGMRDLEDWLARLI